MRIWNSRVYWRNCKRNFQELIKSKVEFLEVIKKIKFLGVLVLDFKIYKGCDKNLKIGFLHNFSWLSNALNIISAMSVN